MSIDILPHIYTFLIYYNPFSYNTTDSFPQNTAVHYSQTGLTRQVLLSSKTPTLPQLYFTVPGSNFGFPCVPF